MAPKQIRCVLVFLLVFCPALFVLRCQNPFSMRDAEEPKKGETLWEPARSPSQLLENFIKSVSDRDADKYKRCLVDSVYSDRMYRFEPDPAVLEIYPTRFENWGTNREEEAMRQAFHYVPDDSTSRLEFTQDLHETFAADSAEYIRQYRLELLHDRDNLPTVFEGQIHLRMTEDARGEWVIYFWNDRNVVPEQPGWSNLKAEFGG